MAGEIKASIIISIYNNIKTLERVLDSLKIQSERNFEIIISEDAQHAETARFCAQYPFVHPYQHLTQPDEGWQKNRALNRAIKVAKCDYLIFIDGDCILHPRFVEFHLRLSSPKSIVAGKRVKLNSELSEFIQQDIMNYRKVERKLRKMLFFAPKAECKFIEEGIFVEPNSLLGKFTKRRKMRCLKGCNMSFSKSAIYAINGFDEDYTAPAVGEDVDLVWRFEAAGYKLVSSRNLAVQYHIHHKENWTDQSENAKMMEQKRAANTFFCINGLDKKGV